jgi:hypothetical protein
LVARKQTASRYAANMIPLVVKPSHVKMSGSRAVESMVTMTAPLPYDAAGYLGRTMDVGYLMNHKAQKGVVP